MSLQSVPTTPEEMSPAWLTAALRQTNVLPQGTVVAVEWEPLGQDRGLTGILARVRLRYAGVPAVQAPPVSLIAKLPTTSRATASLGPPEVLPDSARSQHYARCAREVRFYQEVVPLGGPPVPRCYYGAADERTERVILLLEDLTTARAGDVLAGCTPSEVALVLAELAPWHAHWWAFSRLQEFPWLPHWVGDPRARQGRYQRQVAPFLDRFGQQISPAVLDLILRLRTGYVRVLEHLGQAPTTLLHGDLHLDNLLFLPSSQQARVRFLDWQSICQGAGVIDLTQVLVGSLAVEERRRAQEELIQGYHARLITQGVSGYPLSQLKEHVRFALLWLLAGTVGGLSASNRDALTGRELALVQAAWGDGRLVAALLDQEVGALLPS